MVLNRTSLQRLLDAVSAIELRATPQRVVFLTVHEEAGETADSVRARRSAESRDADVIFTTVYEAPPERIS